jgi:predicted glycogen debranching enzyme
LKVIVDSHMHGTLFNIHMDHDGLISHGPQLTWMDAAPDGRPVTPREGKAVEIQALWFNALRTMRLLASRFGEKDKADEYGSMAKNVQRSFLEEFWNAEKNCFFDVVMNGANKDASLRPNQVLALALDFTMPDKTMSEKALETVQGEFLTSYGLRTLSLGDSRYVGKYRGNRWERDNAYHNGSVWPWLLGPFVTAFLKTKNHESKWRSYAFDNYLKPLFADGLSRACLGSISEIFDGDSPHEPNGCVAQAWSVAEPLRAYVEDVLFQRPPYEKQILTV